MTPERHKQLMDDTKANVTKAEAMEGWHFCPDWDGLLMKIDPEICPCSMWTDEELEDFNE